MTRSDEIKKKADKLINTINRLAASSLESFLVKFPEIENMIKNRTEKDWVFNMTIGGTAAAVMMNRKLTGEESTEIVQSLSNWNNDAKVALDNLLGFIDSNAKSGIDHFTALGLWVLSSIKNEPLTQEENTLADVIGIFLRDSFKGSWDSY